MNEEEVRRVVLDAARFKGRSTYEDVRERWYCDEALGWTENMRINVCGNRTCRQCRKWHKEWWETWGRLRS